MSSKSNEKQNKQTRKENKILTKNVNLNKVQKISLSIVSILMLIAFIIVTVLFIRKNSSKNLLKENVVLDPELARAMTYEQFQDGDDAVEGTDNVKFSAFFLKDLDGDGYVEKLKGMCSSISNSSNELYMDFSINTNGYLKNGEITISSSNFIYSTSIVNDNIIGKAVVGDTKKITLNNKIDAGSQKLIIGNVRALNSYSINQYSEQSTITLTGIYVDDNGVETPISKDVNLTVDWHGTTKTVVNRYKDIYGRVYDYGSQMKNITEIKSANSIRINFDVGVSDVAEELLLREQGVILSIPEINGMYPNRITVNGLDAAEKYNEETKKLTIKSEAVVGENGYLTKIVEHSKKYNVTLYYSKEAVNTNSSETIVINVPITGYSDGFNNPNEEFSNPYYSENSKNIIITYTKLPEGKIIDIYPTIGKYYIDPDTRFERYIVSKQSILELYDGNSSFDEDTYEVAWELTIGDYNSIDTIYLEEYDEKYDSFVGLNQNTVSMRDYTSIKEIKVDYASVFLGNNGWIKVYDADTGEELVKLTSSNNFKHKFASPVKSLKLEISNPKIMGSLKIVQTKVIDDEEVATKIERSDFDEYSYLKTTLKATLKGKEGTTYDNGTNTISINKTAYCDYIEPYSKFNFNISNRTLLSQNEDPFVITINTIKNFDIESKWKNGVFLFEFPEEIINVNVSDIRASIEDVRVRDYSVYSENNKWFLKIYTVNPEEKVYSLSITGWLVTNPMVSTCSKNINLYAYNENCDIYKNNQVDKYDVDDDKTLDDKIGFESLPVTIVAPTGLLTTEYISDYDENGTESIAPNVAEVETVNSLKSAKINISFFNNYSGSISDVKVIGQIPFEGNKFFIANKDMNSEFSVSMTGGINIPDDYKEKFTVYYSEQENVNKNINDIANNWKTEDEVEDWQAIKSYLIDFNDYAMSYKEKIELNYNVIIPDDVTYEKVSYSTHAAYYALNTSDGKYFSQIEPRKAGIRVVRHFDLQIRKNKIGNDGILVDGASYTIKAKLNDNNTVSKVGMTNMNGLLRINDLCINREYTLKELSVGNDYVVNEEEIRFVATLDDGGHLQVNVTSGQFKDELEIEEVDGEKFLVKANLEDEAKYTLYINKINEENEKIQNVEFTIFGENIGSLLKTNENGSIVINNLEPNKDYLIKETKADGYFVDSEDREFKITRNEEGKLIITSNDEAFSNAVIEENRDEVKAKVLVDIVNEKIPTYNLEIIKVEEDLVQNNLSKLERLEGARFQIENEDKVETLEYVTDENGKIVIPDLYQFVEGKTTSGKVVIREIKEPEGYILNSEEIEIKVSKDDDKLKADVTNKDELETLREIEVEGNVVRVYISNKPIFKLTKVDSETGDPLANIKFEIWELDENGDEVDFAKDINGNYVGTIENERYYVETDSTGTVSLPLKPGTYKAIEINTPDKYEPGNEEIFKVGGKNEIPEAEDVEIPTYEDFDAVVEEKDDTDYTVLEINSIEDLVDFSKNVNNGTNYEKYKIVLNRNLDFDEDSSYEDASRTDYGDLNSDGTTDSIKTELTTGKGFTPISTSSRPIQKIIFDGQNFEISNLYINTTDSYVGLFERTIDSEIRNLTLSGNITASSNGEFGGFVGYSINTNFINCTNKVNITSNKGGYLGGIVGQAVSNSNFKNCINYGNLALKEGESYNIYIGGIVGQHDSGCFIGCENESDIKAETYHYLGGIVAETKGNITVADCINNGEIEGNCSSSGNSFVGGIIGYGNSNYNTNYYIKIKDTTNYGTISNKQGYAGGILADCYSNYKSLTIINAKNIGDIFGKNIAGGIVGCSNTSSVIANCESSGQIDGNNYIGGIVGELYNNSNQTILLNNNVTGKFVLDSNYVYVGGEIGCSYQPIIMFNCKTDWDVNINATSSIYYGGLIGQTYYTSIISDCTVMGKAELSAGSETYIGGITGYQKSDPNKSKYTNCVNEQVWNITRNSGNGYGQIGGIIGFVTSGSGTEIINCYNYSDFDFDNVAGHYLGGIVGRLTENGSKIVNCINYGKINAHASNTRAYFGGIVAELSANCYIGNCANKADICGSSSYLVYVGGIVSSAYYSTSTVIENCTNENLIEGKATGSGDYSYAGGIAGKYSAGKISNCSNIGDIILDVGYWCYGAGIAGEVGSCNIESCSNKGDVTVTINNDWLKDIFVGGIVGRVSGSSTISKCFNTGSLSAVHIDGIWVGGIAGDIIATTTITECYNIGSVYGVGLYVGVGGIVGDSASYATITNCYNKGSVLGGNIYSQYSKELYAGGIAGTCNVAYNSYNWGTVKAIAGSYSTNSSYKPYVGGVVGKGNTVSNCYNTANVISYGDELNTGSIIGENKSVFNSYYLDTIKVEGVNINKNGIAKTDEYMKTLNFVNDLGDTETWKYNEGGYPILNKKFLEELVASTEIEIKNKPKQFIVSTEVKNNIGGDISGRTDFPYEVIKYRKNSSKAIMMTPSTDYMVTDITVNGDQIEYNSDESGNVELPEEYFKNVIEDKHVVVTYGLDNNILTLNKTDDETGEPVSGVKFKIDQIENRENPNVDDIFGEIVNDGPNNTTPNVLEETADGVIGDIVNNGEYYYVEVNGEYIPTNGSTYRQSLGEASNSFITGKADSYFEIDLTDKEGEYVVTLDYEANTGYSDYGYAWITNTTQTPSSSTSTNRFLNINSTKSGKVASNILTGGNKYYLHIQNYKQTSYSNGKNEVIIRNIEVHKAESRNTSFGFVKNGNKIESNNQGQNSSIASCYIPIDLTGYSGKYNVRVTASVSAEQNDIAYGVINTTISRPTYYYSSDLYQKGSRSYIEYRKELSGGTKYYLHLIYEKDLLNSAGTDTFTINNIQISLSESDFYHGEMQTNESGKAYEAIPYGKYKITEIETPNNYIPLEEPLIVDFSGEEGAQHEFDVSNVQKPKVIVHHYLKESDGTYTTSKVADDEVYYGDLEERYSSMPHDDLEKLSLEKDENGEFVIPENAAGTFGEDDIEINYYYEASPIVLTIHHCLESTGEELVEAEKKSTNGNVVFDEDGYKVIVNGEYKLNENENYIAFLSEYDLVSIANNLDEEFEISDDVTYDDDLDIIYYYKIKQYNITTEVKEHEEIDELGNVITVKGGTISGENEVPYEIVDYGKDSTNELLIVPDEGYEVKTIEINEEPIDFVPEEDGTVQLENFVEVTEDKHIVVEFQKKQGHVIVHHYVEGTTSPIELEDGSLAPTEYKSGEFGTIYTTKPHEDITKYTVVTEDVENRQGTFVDGTIEVTYYYRLKDARVTVNHYIVNPDGTKTTNPVPLREEGTVAESEEINGKVDDLYETEAIADIELSKNYELVELPSNANGVMTVDPIEVNYYYGLKNTKVIVHHYQEPSETGGEVVKLAEDVEINGHVTDAYTTAQASSEELPRKFEFSRKTDNFEGNMTLEPIEVIYYYKTRDAVLNIKYQDYYTHEDIDTEEHQTGKVDDDYITTEKTIEGWTYQESTGNETGKLEVDPITVIFYYKKQTKVTVNYIDKLTNEALEPATTITGLEGDDYETVAKEFRWYVLTDPEPTNKEGQMTKDEIVVNYYYIRPETSLIEKHIDVTNNEILANETHEGRVGDEYNIPSRTFEGYDLVEERLPDNAEGRYTEEVIEVKYYYIKKARLIVKYIDKYTGEEIPNADGTPTGRDENKHEGDSYTTERKTFDGYVLEEVPTNADGTLEGGTTEVIYYYKQIAGDVIENHINKLTGEKLEEEKRHEGYVGDDYETAPKEYPNFDIVQEDYPTNATGKFKEEEQRVTYYYIQKASVTVRYIDKDTNKDIPNPDGTSSKEDKTGHVGDSYTSTAKPFNGYILEQEPNNKEGTMTEEPITVIYYYRKIKFNLKVEKIIKTITVNGIEQEVNGDLAKAEVYRKELQGQTIKVKYVIKVTNDSELEGSAVIRETIPEGMTMNASTNGEWNIVGSLATLETDIIVPGDEREYEVVLEWKNNGDNIGTKTNNASIVTTNNKYGFEETDTGDNEDSADLIIAVSTGDINYVFGAIGLLIILGGIALTFIKIYDKNKTAK